MLPVESEVRRRWTNVAAAERYGGSFAEMSALQKSRTNEMMGTFRSAEGMRQR